MVVVTLSVLVVGVVVVVTVEVVVVGAVVVVAVAVLVVGAVVVVAPDVACARALPVAESMRATVGGVTAANRPAFSRNRRRSRSVMSFL